MEVKNTEKVEKHLSRSEFIQVSQLLVYTLHIQSPRELR